MKTLPEKINLLQKAQDRTAFLEMKYNELISYLEERDTEIDIHNRKIDEYNHARGFNYENISDPEEKRCNCSIMGFKKDGGFYYYPSKPEGCPLHGQGDRKVEEKKCKHCWNSEYDDRADHQDCEKCCGCKVPYQHKDNKISPLDILRDRLVLELPSAWTDGGALHQKMKWIKFVILLIDEINTKDTK